MDYSVRYTDNNKAPIVIQEGTKDDTTLDVSLFGRIDLEYGEDLNEAMLHIFERFACPQNSASTPTNTFPDYTISGGTLQHPAQGQLWFNSTVKRLFVWNGSQWESIRIQGSVAANWGQILDGSQIPRPVNPANGYVYGYNECIWAVSPASIPYAFTYMVCTTDTNGVVNMKFRSYGDNTLTSGIANYLIIAISGNTNHGSMTVTPLPPNASQTPTPTPTGSVTPTPTVTASITHSPTPVPSLSASAIPSPTPVPTQTPAATNTPAPTSTPPNTPPVTITPTPSPFVDSCTTCTNAGFTCCVAVNSFLPDGKIAGEIAVGDTMILADQETLEPATGKVSYSEPSLQPSVRLVTTSGTSLVCSTTAPIPTKDDGLQNAPDVEGKFIAVMVDGIAGWEECVSVTDVGEQWVQHITVEDKCFWAGEQSSSFILHHNIKCCYCGGDSNCVWQPPNCCMC